MKRMVIVFALVCVLTFCACSENDKQYKSDVFTNKLSESSSDIEPDKNYDMGTELYKSKKYEEAKDCFSIITSEDPNYDKAKEMIAKCDEMIKKNYIDNSDQLMMNDNYDSAIEVIRNALEIYPDDSQLLEKQNECVKKKKDYLFEQSESFEKNKNYIEAITVLVNMGDQYPNDKEIENKLNNLKETALAQIGDYIDNEQYGNALTDYRALLEAFPDDRSLKKSYNDSYDSIVTAILDKSNEKYESEGYQSAIQYLNAVSSMVTDDRINERIDYYYGFEPVYLNDLEPYSGEVEYDVENIDNYENEYYHSVWLSKSEIDSDHSEKVVYCLKKQYTVLNGVLAVPHWYREDNGWKVRLEIYCDDIRVYSSDVIDYKTKPVSLDIDVSGTDFLEFRWLYVEGDYYSQGQMATLYDTYLTKN